MSTDSHSRYSSFILAGLIITLAFLFTTAPAWSQADQPTCYFKNNHKNKLIVKNATPNEKVLLFRGFKLGEKILSNASCEELSLGIANGKKIASIRMNSEGNKQAKVKIPPAAEQRGFIQMVDLDTCTVGDVRKAVFTPGQIPNGKVCVYEFENNPIDSCPCFDASSIEGQGIDYDAESLTNVSCNDNSPSGATLNGDRPGGFNWQARIFNDPDFGPSCDFDDQENDIAASFIALTDANLLACQNIILQSQMWAINCIEN